MWWLALAACSDPTMGGGGPGDSGTDGGGQTGAEYPTGCEEVGRTAISADDASELGFSLDDLLVAAGGPRTARLDWSDGGSTDLSLDLEADGTVDWVEYDEATGPTGTGALGAPAMMCSDVLEFPASVAFATDDGAFDEELDLTLQTAAADAVDFWATLDADDLAGTYQIHHLVDGTPNPQVAIGGSLGASSSGTIWEQPGESPPPPTETGAGSTGSATAGTATAWPSFEAATWTTP